MVERVEVGPIGKRVLAFPKEVGVSGEGLQ